MSNIWEVLLQSCTITICAAILLIVKSALRDKLSPRWQYGVWGALALRIVWPTSMSKTLIFNFPLWFELLKTQFENGSSAYADKYVPLDPKSGLPWITAAPRSFVDWLFIIYIIGIFVFLLRHLWGYIRLRSLLRCGGEPDVELREIMERVCSHYGLRPCRIVTVAELPTAFVCGVFRPVLAVPAEKLVDDKVLLHELLHLRHQDVLQNVLWCCLRALHWWNIFLIPVFERIGNELESLCDQRVLERLEGEERREYGGILLGMASKKYARAVGTSSISNGGEFISERIEAIARFKKYPQGMALVSLCIAFVLGIGLLSGSVQDYQGTNFTRSAYTVNNADNINRSMAVTRLARCRTAAAAIDTYAKAMFYSNGYYLATASPIDEQEFIKVELETNRKPNHADVHIDSGAEFEYLQFLGTSGYLLGNYTENPDGTVDAVLQFGVSRLQNNAGEQIIYEYVRDGEELFEHGGAVMLSVRAEETENGWIAYETAERRLVLKNKLNRLDLMGMTAEPGFEKTIHTPHGNITLLGIVNHSMTPFSYGTFFYDEKLHLDSEYTETMITKLEYDLLDFPAEGITESLTTIDWPASDVSMEIVTIQNEGDEWSFVYDYALPTRGTGNTALVLDDTRSYTSWSTNFFNKFEACPYLSKMELDEVPWGYAVRICWDDEIVEEIVFPLEEVLGQ